MAVPKKRKTSTKSKLHRTGAYKFSLPGFIKCSNCKAWTRPHIVCANCGTYDKKKVIEPKSKVVRRSKKTDDKKSDKE